MDRTVSVIMPVHNNASTVEEAVLSVMAQTYPYWELMLVDDASTDEVLPLLQQLTLADERIHLYTLSTNRGAAKARNEGILHARGRFIAFLDADDTWLPEKLELQVHFMLEHQTALSHTSYQWVDPQGKALDKVIHAEPVLTYDDMLDYNYIGCLTAMYDTKLLGRKYFMPEIEKRQDYGLWLRIMRQGVKARGLDVVLAHYRTGAKSLSSNKWSSALYNWKILREYEGLNVVQAVKHFLRYAVKGVVKYR